MEPELTVLVHRSTLVESMPLTLQKAVELKGFHLNELGMKSLAYTEAIRRSVHPGCLEWNLDIRFN